MNEYRVDLWIENQGDIPDLYFQVQTNAGVLLDELVVAALVMARIRWVERVEVQVRVGALWVWQLTRVCVSLDGVENMKYGVTRSESDVI